MNKEKNLKEVKVHITTSIPFNIHELAKRNDISWNEALVFGIQFLIADRDGIDYPSCNLLNKKVELSKKIVEMKLARENPVDAEKEAEDVFNELKNAEIEQ